MRSTNLPKILLFNPEEATQESLRVILEDHCHLFIAQDGEEAFKFLDDFNPDLIFLNEIETLKKVQSLKSNAKIIMIEDEKTPETVKARDPGIFDYIYKPFDVEELRTLIKKALTQRVFSNEPSQPQDVPIDSLKLNEKKGSLKELVSAFEKQLIEDTLKKSRGVLTHAAKLLNTTRRILKYRIDQLKIHIRKEDYK
jgi:DNA-binding NtrC family response regulator